MSGQIGTISGNRVSYALYRLIDSSQLTNDLDLLIRDYDAPPYNQTAAALFLESGPLEPFWWDIGNGGWFGVWYEEPRKLITPTGQELVFVPKQYDGTAGANDDAYLQWTRGGWQRIDTMSWLTELGRHVPAGLEVWRRVRLDLEQLQVEVSLWRQGDANCCPSGGTAIIKFALRDDVLPIVTVQHRQPG